MMNRSDGSVSFEVLRKNLCVVAKITEGGKLSSTPQGEVYTQEYGWLQTIARSWNKQDKKQTIRLLQDIYSQAGIHAERILDTFSLNVIYYRESISEEQEKAYREKFENLLSLSQAIKDSRSGLRNLRVTYQRTEVDPDLTMMEQEVDHLSSRLSQNIDKLTTRFKQIVVEGVNAKASGKVFRPLGYTWDAVEGEDKLSGSVPQRRPAGAAPIPVSNNNNNNNSNASSSSSSSTSSSTSNNSNQIMMGSLSSGSMPLPKALPLTVNACSSVTPKVIQASSPPS